MKNNTGSIISVLLHVYECVCVSDGGAYFTLELVGQLFEPLETEQLGAQGHLATVFRLLERVPRLLQRVQADALRRHEARLLQLGQLRVGGEKQRLDLAALFVPA